MVIVDRKITRVYYSTPIQLLLIDQIVLYYGNEIVSHVVPIVVLNENL